MTITAQRPCPDCQGCGERSKVYVGETAKTADGKTTEYSCSRGHSWTVNGRTA